MNQSIKAVLAFVLIMAVVFGAVYLYRYGLPRAEIASSDTSSGSSTATSTASSSSGSSTSGNSSSVESAASTALSYIMKVGDIVRSVISWIIGSVKSSDVSTTIVRGAAISAAFFILGYLVHIIAKFIKFILYSLGAITAVVTILVVIGLL